MTRKPKPVDQKPPAPAASGGDTADQAAPGVTVASSPTDIPAAPLAAPGWSIKITTRKGRTQPRYRIGRAFGPEPVTIAVDDLTTEEMQALHEDVDLVVTPADNSEENGN